jgi:hypothetical protein
MVPVGVPGAPLVTVAVNVTDWFKWEGFGEEATTVVSVTYACTGVQTPNKSRKAPTQTQLLTSGDFRREGSRLTRQRRGLGPMVSP